MKRKQFVLVYDSGIGGLTTLSNLIKTAKGLNYIYFADTQNSPYGNKCKTKLQEIVINNIKALQNQYIISHIVLACNTATTITIDYLRKNLNIPIIGTEPNIKSPIKNGAKNIMVLSTPLTSQSKRLKELENETSFKFKNIGIKNLAKLIENYQLNKNKQSLNEINLLINKTLTNSSVNTAIVLGCTHYVFIKSLIEKKGYTCYDGNQGVANRLKAMTKDLQNPLSYKPIVHIITSNIRTTLKYKKILKSLLNKNK